MAIRLRGDGSGFGVSQRLHPAVRCLATSQDGTAQCHALLARLIERGRSRRPARTAANLITEFGSLPAVLAATEYDLLVATDGDRSAVSIITEFRETMMQALRCTLHQRPIISDWRTLADYLRQGMAFERVECIRVLFMDAKNGLIIDEETARGTIDEAPLFSREIVRRALQLGAAGFIMAHNHPSGDPAPSLADIRGTRSLCEAARAVGISVIDHVIIGRDGHASFRSLGLI